MLAGAREERVRSTQAKPPRNLFTVRLNEDHIFGARPNCARDAIGLKCKRGNVLQYEATALDLRRKRPLARRALHQLVRVPGQRR